MRRRPKILNLLFRACDDKLLFRKAETAITTTRRTMLGRREGSESMAIWRLNTAADWHVYET
ncbi:hypothetical protein I3842_02G052200 [Carya illinoinensis]|uniref:Uncharacterized protein n=1 Tax=Carya illinoinensis TaxID=32201 RepID=A0A922K259_CARIL|nr:hypothetical protein I3842_02G052200 [Carya illinoinensis]